MLAADHFQAYQNPFNNNYYYCWVNQSKYIINIYINKYT